MFNLIKKGNIVADEWKTLKLARGDTPHNARLPVGPLLVPLSVWQARRAELIHREYEHGWPLGIWLSAEEKAESIAADIDDFTVIAIELDQYAENHWYDTAAQLRENYGYTGELRAIVQDDDVNQWQKPGFNTNILVDYSKTSIGTTVPSDLLSPLLALT